MARPKGHVTIDGKDYICVDESLQSKVVPLFRPQLVVEGITREALEQYLYMAQDTWDTGSYEQARKVARWQNGGFGRIDGIDNSIPNRIQLQRKTEVSLPFTDFAAGNLALPTRLVSIAGWLLAFREDGAVRRLGKVEDGWSTVAYDFATYGKVCFVDVATSGGGGQLSGGIEIRESSYRLLIGTITGNVFFAKYETVSGTPTIIPIQVQTFGTTRINCATTYRNQVAVGVGNKVIFKSIQSDGTWTPGGTNVLEVNCPGAPVAIATWNQVAMIAVQTSTRGSVIIAANLSQAIDSYRTDGGFAIQSIVTWGGQLVYGGKAFRSSEVYSFPGTLADRLPPGSVPTDVLALHSTHRHVLVGWNGHGGIWWVHDKGAGALAQYDVAHATLPNINRRVRSIAVHHGEVFWTLDDAGVIRARSDQYRTSGKITTGWFDGGFPELQKNFADLFIRLQEPLKSIDSVNIKGRVDGKAEVDIGTVATGRVDATFPMPATLQQGRRINLTLALTTTGVAGSAAQTDDFNRADNVGLGANWTEVETSTDSFRIATNNLRIGQSGNAGYARYTGASFTNDQFSELKVVSLPSTDLKMSGPAVRLSGGSALVASGYAALYRSDTATIQLRKYVNEDLQTGGSGTLLGSVAGALAAGDKIKITAVGTVISVYKNEIQILSVTDASIATGGPGALSTVISGAGGVNFDWDDWRGGDNQVSSTPIVTALVLRYRPVPFQQRVWGFTVKVAKWLGFLDGTQDNRSPATILTDLFALPNKGQVNFNTVMEPTSKKVYITNVEMKHQLMGRSRGDEPEEVYVAVEALETAALLDNTAVSNPPQLDPDVLPLEDPDRGDGDDVNQPGIGAAPINEGGDRHPEAIVGT